MIRKSKQLLLLVLMAMGTANAWADDYEASVTTESGITTSYTSFDDAVDEAKTARTATITLLKDCEVSFIDVEKGEDITISGGEYTLTMYDFVNVYSGGKLTITDGKYTTSSDWFSYNAQMFYLQGGTTTINGGEFNTTNCDTPIKAQGGTLTINAGTFYGKDRGLIVEGGDVTLNGGTFSGGNGGIYCATDLNALLGEDKCYYNTSGSVYLVELNDKMRINQSIVVDDIDREITLKMTDFSSPVSSASTLVAYKLDDKFSLQVYADNSVTTAADAVSCSYNSLCSITLSNISALKLTSMEMTFASEAESPSNAANGFNAEQSTDGLVISGNKVTYSGDNNIVSLNFNLCASSSLKLTGIKVTYKTNMNVSTAEEFQDALSKNIDINLAQDIDLSSLTGREGGDAKGYLFDSYTNHKIVGNGHTLKNSNYPLFYSTSGIVVKDLVLDGFTVTGATSLIARTSSGGYFLNITVKNSSLTALDGGSNIGMIVGYSANDIIEYCTVESGCSITTNKEVVGGIVGQINNDKSSTSTCHIRYCQNAASITTTDWYAGGIAGANKCGIIEYCLNTGLITSNSYCVGGITGSLSNSAARVNRCVNAGRIDDSEGGDVAGIVGIDNPDSGDGVKCINECFWFLNGSFNCPTITNSDAYNADKNNYYYSYDEENITSRLGVSYKEIATGEYAFKTDWLYQDLDNNTSDTHFPVPIPSAGTVYSNILCDGTQSYSNKYQSTGAHESELDDNGICTICGAHVKHIADADGLIAFATDVNNGSDYSRYLICLDNDIDLEGKDFTPIGNEEYPFIGIFNGQGHRIKSMILNSNTGNVGLFGIVSGANSIVKNTIIDSSCSVTSTSGYGVAGLIGCVSSTEGSICNLTIENCGNEANVTGINNVAGLLGSVYSNNRTFVNVDNCYNTGAIAGNTKSCSASIVGYARLHTSISNTYNSGTVGGTNDWLTFAYTGEDSDDRGTFDGTIKNCYTTVSGDKTPNVTKITSNDVNIGNLCNKLNANHGDLSAWTQDLGEGNSHPSFGENAIHYSRIMDNQWGTICLPFDAVADNNDDYDFYELSEVKEDELTLKKITGTLSAGTPAIVRRSGAATGIDVSANGSTIVGSPVVGSSANGITLTGAFTTTEVTDKDGYLIINNSFWKIDEIKGTSKVFCPSFHAYLDGTIASGARQLTIGTDEETTAIENIVSSLQDLDGATIYDIKGRRLSGLQQGVNIVKMSDNTTKKIIIK